MDIFDKIKRGLISKQKEVEDKLRSIDQEELILNQATPETMEEGAYSWQADTNATKMAVRKQLLAFLEKIQTTLSKLNQGTYGKCEKCNNQIEQARLEIMPTANLCINCKEISGIIPSKNLGALA